MPGAGDYLSGAGSVISGSFDLLGSMATSSGLQAAAQEARHNAIYSQQGTEIELLRQDYKTESVLGGIRADAASSGLKTSGNMIDILRQSTRDAAMDRALISIKGQMDVNDWNAKAKQYMAQAKAASNKGLGSFISGLVSMAGFAI